MQAFGPFGDEPVFAVAVSGGGDSMALLRLASIWAHGVGARILALTVDHGLRPQSADEAICVAQWCSDLDVSHETLRWHPDPLPRTAVHATAREARYRLLEAAMLKRGILHLLTAHHADDQAETVELRRQKSSTATGLSGMSAIVEHKHMRILRPLLRVTHENLLNACRGFGQAWIEDPSNVDTRFGRGRLRSGGIAGSSRIPVHDRAATEQEVARGLALCASIHPQGWARLSLPEWHGLPCSVALQALASLLRCIGGQAYAPSSACLSRLARQLAGAFPGASLAGCLLSAAKSGIVEICREMRNLPAPVKLSNGHTAQWDRFALRATASCEVRPLNAVFQTAGHTPPRAMATQPAFFVEGRLAALPTLGFAAPGYETAFEARFAPRRAVADALFAIV